MNQKFENVVKYRGFVGGICRICCKPLFEGVYETTVIFAQARCRGLLSVVCVRGISRHLVAGWPTIKSHEAVHESHLGRTNGGLFWGPVWAHLGAGHFGPVFFEIPKVDFKSKPLNEFAGSEGRTAEAPDWHCLGLLLSGDIWAHHDSLVLKAHMTLS